MNRVVTLPSDVLSLTLVILMGILGSLLQIVYSFFRKDTPSEGPRHLFRAYRRRRHHRACDLHRHRRPAFRSSPTRRASAATRPINPYLIRSSPIISGLLSEQAIASVQARGAQFFSRPIRPWMSRAGPRMDLTQSASSDGKSIDQLAAYLNLKPKAATDILKGLVPATIPSRTPSVTYLHGSARGHFHRYRARGFGQPGGDRKDRPKSKNPRKTVPFHGRQNRQEGCGHDDCARTYVRKMIAPQMPETNNAVVALPKRPTPQAMLVTDQQVVKTESGGAP